MPKRSKAEVEEQKLLGQRIRHHRLRLDLTQNQIADHLEVPYQMVQRLERGTATITIPRLIKLAEVFHLDPSDLLRDLAQFDAREEALATSPLTDEERRLLEAFHRIPDKVQRHNVLDLLERMVR